MREFLVFRAGGLRCALPIGVVEEILRPSTITSLSGVPPYVLGTARIRGTTTPLVDLGQVLTGERVHEPRRLVSLRLDSGERRVALAVDAVQGVLPLDLEIQALPPLLSGAAAGLVRSSAELDEDLAVMNGGKVLPAELWLQREALEGEEL